MARPLHVVQISETEFSVKGHGVHTAYFETVRALGMQSDVTVAVNSWKAADIRHIHTIGPYAVLQLLFGRGRKVISAHVVPESFVGSLVGTKYWLPVARGYLRWLYNRASVVIAVSDETRRQLQALGVRSRIELVYNMVDTSQYAVTSKLRTSARKNLKIDAATTVVIGNGQVQPRKRFDTFVEIARSLPDMRFIWVGGMPFGRVAADAAEMQRLIDSAPKNVSVTGVIPLEKVREYLAAGDIFVMTSIQETFGLAIVEAAASGLPIVLRDIQDYDKTFRGDAVMCNDAEFARAVKRLATDRAYYREMQQHAHTIAARFDSHTIGTQLVGIYRSTIPSEAGIIKDR